MIILVDEDAYVNLNIDEIIGRYIDFDDLCADGFICVEYESGNAFRYSDIDLPFMNWTEIK